MFLFEAILTRALESVAWKHGMLVLQLPFDSRKTPFPFVFYVAGCASCAVARINTAHCVLSNSRILVWK